MERQFDPISIKELYDAGIITNDHVPRSRLDIILKAMANGTFKVWSEESFDPNRPPETNAGVSICYDCGKMYWCTPFEDAYEKTGMEGEGKVCERCLLKR